MHWGVDLGGTKIEGVVLDKDSPVARIRIETEPTKGYDHIIGRVAELVGRLKHETGLVPSSIGIGHPGVLDPKTLFIKNSNTQCLNGKPLKHDLEQALGAPTLVANDANCFALAEATLGAARGASVVFGVIMGTGVGGGVVVRGEVHEGANGIAGEWGHNVLIEGGTPCYCGKQGCVETVISGPALERFYHERSGGSLTLSEILAAKSVAADETRIRLAEQFGRALAIVINILDPNVVVLGGGVSNAEVLYSEGISAVRNQVFNDKLETRILRNQLGDSAGVIGAALLTRGAASTV